MGIMKELVGGADGARLAQAAYTPDFMERFWRIGAEGFWKLERMQHYDEGDFPSWLAFRRGDWAESLRLVEELRPEYEEYFDRIGESGFGHHRVRIVERPVTPYVQWELNVLRVKYAYGERVSVLEADRVAGHEDTAPLPELCVLGAEAVYVLDYTDEGVPDGATRYTDPEAVERSRAFLRDLYAAGEDLGSYFDREIAPLPAPTGDR
ncbi:hypothetical protein GL263_01815 [Streptomyces durbertensis]|uniref:DUF6879 domain-containing protein n=1 Tax=Streptomyces durbertensis TaxID=2448886 RepID=A0ABR6EAF4_9ACTN|nr:DUF6879 family protein [Streptomyces durbertensis]MBB1242317.1 hypothetical protein [Streptomyces durbertensis]